MVFADAPDLLLDQLLGRGDAGVDLAGSVERENARRIELEDLPALRIPFGDRLVDPRKDSLASAFLRCRFRMPPSCDSSCTVDCESSARPPSG